jgi:hypothetical protein
MALTVSQPGLKPIFLASGDVEKNRIIPKAIIRHPRAVE